MRSILSQDHATNLRDLLLNYELDQEGFKVIDFTYGKGGFWRISYKYRLAVTKTDAVPTDETVIRKDLIKDDYSDLGLHDAGTFDPPYLFGDQEVFDASKMMNGTTSWSHTGDLKRFTHNESMDIFLERIKALNRVAASCIKLGGLLFVKVMDTRQDGYLTPNHAYIIEQLDNFKLYALYVYIANGAVTWKQHSQTAHGYWMVFKLVKDIHQQTL